MKKKTLLSTLALFLLLQPRSIHADNFLWNIFTAPVIPWALTVGFWGIIRLAEKWFPTIEVCEATKEQNIKAAEERNAIAIAKAAKRHEHLVAKMKRKNKKIKGYNNATFKEMEAFGKECNEKVKEININQTHHTQLVESRLSSFIKQFTSDKEQQLQEAKREIDTSFAVLKETTKNQLNEEQERTSKFALAIRKKVEYNRNKLQEIEKNNAQNYAANIATLKLSNEQINGMGTTVQGIIHRSQLQQTYQEEQKSKIEQLRKDLDEINEISRRIKTIATPQIKLPGFSENIKKRFHDFDKKKFPYDCNRQNLSTNQELLINK